ncbi:MAG: metal ABC transporter permease [Thermoplasmata archaeon]|nr:MAG: metal ABC transporter permease [Thermoplasmata archaeon]
MYPTGSSPHMNMEIDGSGNMLNIIGYLDVPFVQRMLIAGMLAALACGVMGTLVVVRRNVFIAGGISHTAFGGIGLAYYLQGLGLTWFDPMLGAILSAIGAAFLLGSESIKKRYREDSTIGAIWVVGMAAGVLLINLVDRNKVQVLSFEAILFGNILLTSVRDLMIMAGTTGIIYGIVIFKFKDMEMTAFDPEFARISGVRVTALNLVMLVMTALTVVILIKVVGVVLVLAMLTIPAAISNLFTKRLSRMMVLSTIMGVMLTAAGTITSIAYDTPPGATIVMLMGACFIAALLGKWIYIRARFSFPGKA